MVKGLVFSISHRSIHWRDNSHYILSFLDVYFGYNQIKMNMKEQRKTTSIANYETYSYNVMLYRLKNVGVTYQRWVNGMFKQQIGKSM